MMDARYEVKVLRDLVYSRAGGVARLADLYLPLGTADKPPVIVWVHGGGWRFGDRNLAPNLERWFAERGFAMVSFDYRLSSEALFPAQVIDLKTVVRWVRSVADQYGLDAEAIGLWGSSAGAHLAACAALSADDQFLSEEHAAYGSAVQAVVDAYGATDFTRIDEDRIAVPPKVADAETVLVRNVLPASDPDSFESRLIGSAVSKDSSAVRFASPLSYVHGAAPPFLILHGQSDALVPWTQGLFLYEALERVGNLPAMVLFERFGHGFLNNSDLDDTNAGETTVYRSGRGPSSTLQPLKCFAVCERFFRHFLFAASRDAEPFDVEAP